MNCLLTINGSNFHLVERPQMTVSVNFSRNGIRTANYAVAVMWSHVCIIQWAYIKLYASHIIECQ